MEGIVDLLCHGAFCSIHETTSTDVNLSGQYDSPCGLITQHQYAKCYPERELKPLINHQPLASHSHRIAQNLNINIPMACNSLLYSKFCYHYYQHHWKCQCLAGNYEFCWSCWHGFFAASCCLYIVLLPIWPVVYLLMVRSLLLDVGNLCWWLLLLAIAATSSFHCQYAKFQAVVSDNWTALRLMYAQFIMPSVLALQHLSSQPLNCYYLTIH